MANQTTNEPRALSAALAAPEFVTRGAGVAAHVANRHVERWAPEAGANRVRSMRSLGFVDRLVAPWIETAQRSASLRLFSQYRTSGAPERAADNVSWVFPRPWYQDELDWMAAARLSAEQQAVAAPTMLTTRGTYVPNTPAQRTAPQQAPQAAPRMEMPSALYEYVAPSLSLHAPQMTGGGDGARGGVIAPSSSRNIGDTYSPLVSLAAVQAAQLVARMAPFVASRASTPTLRGVLGSIVERAAMAQQAPEILPTRLSQSAPELVTPPAPRPEWSAGFVEQQQAQQVEQLRIAEQAADQRAKIVELQRVSRQVAAQQHASSPVAASSAASSSAASPSVVAEAQQREAEIRARVGETQGQRAAQQASIAAADRAAAQVVERQRVEAQIAQRVAERTATKKLHESARAEAIEHARAAAADAATTPSATSPTSPTSATSPNTATMPSPRVPAEVLAAIAALPPELARAITSNPTASPLQMIAELGESLRTTELLARNAAAGRSIEVTRGPRLMMPAGLGGLVATISSLEPQAASATCARFTPASIAGSTPMPTYATYATTSAARMPSLPWIAANRPMIASAADVPAMTMRAGAGPTAPRPIAQTALAATTMAQPQTLQHVAWADRWLARFAGAAPRTLDTLSATAGGTRELRLQALADAAPGTVFVAPQFDIEDAPQTRVDASGRVSSGGSSPLARTLAASQTASLVAPSASGTSPAAIESTSTGPIFIDRSPTAPHAVERFDDNAETPDDLFVQIAASAARRRAPATTTTTVAQAQVQQQAAVEQARQDGLVHTTYVDALARAVPMAPGAGLSASLSASPFAPALQHVLPLASARPFDVRALFGGELAATYLAGLLTPSTHEVASAAPMPAWARGFELAAMPTLGGELATRAVPELDMAYVAPDAFGGADATIDTSPVTADATTETMPVAQQREVVAQQQIVAQQQREMVRQQQQLTTLRSALLSWTVDDRGAISAPTTTAFGHQTMTGVPEREVGEANLAMPMLGDVIGSESQMTWGAPGMVGSRAHAWSVAQERSTTDLALDFVSPELVLAARVYGFGPAEAIQAARLAIAGPTQLTAMAGAVDRTFVQAMAVEVERQRAAIHTAYPDATGAVRVIPRQAPGMPVLASQDAAGFEAGVSPTTTTASQGTMSSPATMPAHFTPSTSAFGIERRSPRGAFLWPAAAVAALGVHAPTPDGNLGMTVAALELLAAQAVAELGTYASLHPAFAAQRELAAADEAAPISGIDMPTLAGSTGSASTSVGAAIAAQQQQGFATATQAEPRDASEADVLGTVAAMIPAARRARFDALYVALGQSTQSREWSPAARAARALALVGRGDVDTANLSAHERAATVWDVLPVVYALGERGPDGATTAPPKIGGLPSTSRAAMRAPGQSFVATPGSPDIIVDGRPGLSALSARAGEALGSYVTPMAGAQVMSSATGHRDADPASLGAMHRVPTAAPELVRTGSRPQGRHGGGETEIPAWFESAARKMFGDRNAQQGLGGDISLAELTLIQQAPANQVAASTRSTSAPAPAPVQSPTTSSQGGAEIDVEKIAYEVYRHIVDLMDHARTRNGESYL